MSSEFMTTAGKAPHKSPTASMPTSPQDIGATAAATVPELYESRAESSSRESTLTPPPSSFRTPELENPVCGSDAALIESMRDDHINVTQQNLADNDPSYDDDSASDTQLPPQKKRKRRLAAADIQYLGEEYSHNSMTEISPLGMPTAYSIINSSSNQTAKGGSFNDVFENGTFTADDSGFLSGEASFQEDSETTSTCLVPQQGLTKGVSGDELDTEMADAPISPIPFPELTDEEFYTQEGLDERVERSAIRKDDSGGWVMPRGCRMCLSKRQFCSRGTPCSRCAKFGFICNREGGTQKVTFKAVRSARRERATVSSALPMDNVGKPHPPVRIRGDNTQKTASDNPAVESAIPQEAAQITDAESDLISSQSSTEVVLSATTSFPDQEYHPTISVGNGSTTTPVTAVRGPATSTLARRGRPKETVKQAIGSATTTSSIPINKPQCIGLPAVWAKTRQELCETVLYYRAFQSGAYCKDGVVYGSLLDSADSPRDFMDGRIVISHTGGGSMNDEEGRRVLARDQTDSDAVVLNLRRNMKWMFPATLILGQKCSAAPAAVPFRYAVMDHFKVTHNWQEKCPINGRIRQKFRYEKMDCTTTGWWDNWDSPNIVEVIVEASCKECRESSPQVYELNWTCLNSKCKVFWKQFDGYQGEFKFASSFVNGRTVWPAEYCVERYPLFPAHPTLHDDEDMSRQYDLAHFRGICCPQCGRCIIRVKWAGWECPTVGCSFKKMRKEVVLYSERLANPSDVVFTGPPYPNNILSDSSITETRSVIKGMTVVQYDLPGCGTVTHILANSSLNASEHEGADWMLEKYQSLDQPFERRPLNTGAGQMYTRQFTYNSGAPYRYVATHEKEFSWEDVPRVALRAKQFLQERVGLVHDGTAVFNEILSVGYFETNKMSYHDDGETGLGPTVASISLGSAAVMRFRRKTKAVTSTDANGTKSRTKKNSRVSLELKLKHGDIMIMNGAQIQSIWEHEVENMGLFRIAATARFISPENYETSHKFNHPSARKHLAPSAQEAAAPETQIGNSEAVQQIDQELGPVLEPAICPDDMDCDYDTDVGEQFYMM